MSDASQLSVCPIGPPQPRRRLRGAMVWTAERVAGGLDRWCGNRPGDAFGILSYHRVTERVPGVEAPTWNVTPDQLRLQLAGLLERGFEAWPLNRLIDVRRAKEEVPPRVFAVTFDDGYANNCVLALPVLKELNVPATIFLATGFLDTDRPFPFDDWPAAGSCRVPTTAWRPLSTAQCRELLASGIIEFGAHTHRHELFVDRPEAFRRDLDVCLDVLREKLGVVPAAFAFPWGVSTPELVAAAKQAGIACSMSTRRARVGVDDEFLWGRFNVEARDSAAVLAGKLSGWYTTVATAGKAIGRSLSILGRPKDHDQPGRERRDGRFDHGQVAPFHAVRVGPHR